MSTRTCNWGDELSLDELDLRARRPLEIREVHHRPAGELERPRLGGELDRLLLELHRLRSEVGRAPANVIDRVAFARHRLAALDENPHAAPLQTVEAILQLARFAGELLLVPRERRRRIRSAQVHV